MASHILSDWFERVFGTAEGEDQLVNDCIMWCTFVEYRHFLPDSPGGSGSASEDERAVYDAYCFCGMMDTKGLSALLAEPTARFQTMARSMSRVGLGEVVDNAGMAASAIRAERLYVHRESDRARIAALVLPFEEQYRQRLRKRAYLRLKRFIERSDFYAAYSQNVKRCAREGVSCYDPNQWSGARLA